MAKRKFRFTSKSLFTWLLLCSFLIFLSPQSITGKFQLIFADIFHWPLNFGRNIMLSAVDTGGSDENLTKRERELINQVSNLQAMLKDLQKKYEDLAGIRATYPFEGAKFIQANITRSTNTEFIIDRGQNDQIRSGLYVFGENSIIGIIGDVSATTAKIRLITNPSCKIEVKIGESNTILQGDGKNIKIKSLLKKIPVKTGDQVFCLPKTGLLNAPIIIGTVTECKNGDSPYQWDITVKSAANISALTSVGVIKY